MGKSRFKKIAWRAERESGCRKSNLAAPISFSLSASDRAPLPESVYRKKKKAPKALGNIQTNDLVVLMGRMSLNYCSCQKAPRIIRYVLRAESISGDFSWRFDTKIDHPASHKVSELEPPSRRLMQCKNLLCL